MKEGDNRFGGFEMDEVRGGEHIKPIKPETRREIGLLVEQIRPELKALGDIILSGKEPLSGEDKARYERILESVETINSKTENISSMTNEGGMLLAEECKALYTRIQGFIASFPGQNPENKSIMS